MLDFSKIFNIVFASVCAVLLLFILISAIAVAAKGKRGSNAFDIILRVVCTVVLVASAAMLAGSVLCMLGAEESSMCIVVSSGETSAATLVIGEKLIELPMPDLFVALSSVIGFGLSAVLFMLSLVTLIVDCLVANKKDKKKKQKKAKASEPKKTPEQLKREAEIERIRRIGESAVRKTSSVAGSEKTDKSEQPAAEQSAEQPVAEQPAEQADADQDFDWRTEPAAEPAPAHTGFVGIKDEQDEFDSFDSFDNEEVQASEEVAEDVTEEAETEEAVYESEQQPADEYAQDEADEYEDDAEQTEQPAEEIYYDDDEQFTVDVPEQAEYDEAVTDDQTEYDESEETVEEVEEDEIADDVPAEETYEPEEIADEAEESVEPEAAEELVAEDLPQDIEPDRGIYIPEIRTVTRGESAPDRPAVKKSTAPQKAPAPKKSSAPKKAKPKKSSGGGVSQQPVPPEKKLPVTRRYVILDRHNAVNMFGEYLKERNQAEKDKLKSSINTIIIE